MKVNRYLIRIALTLGMFASISAAFAADYSEPVPSGITDAQVEGLSIRELDRLLNKIRVEQTMEPCDEIQILGDIVRVKFDMDSSYFMTIPQWESVWKRVVTAILIDDGQEFMDAYTLAMFVNRYMLANDQLSKGLNAQQIVEAAITRFHDPDPLIAQHACYLAIGFQPLLPMDIDMLLLINLADSAPTPTHKVLIMRCVSALRFSQTQTPAVDTKIVATARAILDDPASTRPQRMEALSSIKNATSAPLDAGKLAAEQYYYPPDDDQRMALFVLTQLVSIYDNPNAESRKIATEIAIPIFIHAARSDDWSLQMSAAGAARHLYDKAQPLVPELLEMIDHPDINVSGMAISALGNIGPSAKDALPKLRSINGTRGDLDSSIRDALYLIAKEGDKPSWYDNHIKQLKEAGIEVD